MFRGMSSDIQNDLIQSVTTLNLHQVKGWLIMPVLERKLGDAFRSSSVRSCWECCRRSGPPQFGGNGECVTASTSVTPEADGKSMDGSLRHISTRGGDGSNKNITTLPMHIAARMGCINCLRWMIEEEGLDRNKMDSDGRTPLHLVAKKGHTEAAKYLLSTGASLLLDRQGKSPVNYAAENEQMECLSLFIMYGTGSRDKGEFRLKDDTMNSRCTCHQNFRNELIEVQKSPTLTSSDSLSSSPTSSPSPFPSPVHQPFFLHPPRPPCRNSSDDVYVPAQSDPGTHASTPRWMESATEQNKQRSNTLNIRGGNCACRPGWKNNGEQNGGFFLHKPWQEECRGGSSTSSSDRCRDLFNSASTSSDKKQEPTSSQSESESGSESGYAEIDEDYKKKRFSAQGVSEETHRSSVTSDTSYSELSDPAAENDYEDIYISQQNSDAKAQLETTNSGDIIVEADSESPDSIPPPPEFEDNTLRPREKDGKRPALKDSAFADSFYSNQSDSYNPPPPPPPPPLDSPAASTPPSPSLSIGEAAKKLPITGFLTGNKHNGPMESPTQVTWLDAKKLSPRARSQSASSDDYIPSVPPSVCEDDLESNADSESGRESNGFVTHTHRSHMSKNQQLFIPPQFPNPTESDCLIKPSEYLKSISKIPSQNRSCPVTDLDDNEDARSTTSSISRMLPAIPETDDNAAPPPPPFPTPNYSSPCPSPVPQVLAAISVQELASVQLKRTNNKLIKTMSAPPKTDDSTSSYQQKTDLIAELKQSKDIIGIRKLKEERAQVEEKTGKSENDEYFKQFTTEVFYHKIPEVDVGGNPVPNWKRMMLARKAAERARQEAEEKRERDREEKRIQAIPPWKRQLLQRKEKEDLVRRSNPNLSLALAMEDRARSFEDSDVNKENEMDTDSNHEQRMAEESEPETEILPIIPWRAQLRKTNSKLNLNE